MFTQVSKKLSPTDAEPTNLYMYNGGADFIYALINAIKELNAKILTLKNESVETKKLCVEDICVTKEQFLRIIEQSNVTNSQTPSIPSVPETTEEPTEAPAPGVMVDSPFTEPAQETASEEAQPETPTEETPTAEAPLLPTSTTE